MTWEPPKIGQKWRYKPNRGYGTFNVIRVGRERVTLVGNYPPFKHKSLSFKTLRGDYERVS